MPLINRPIPIPYESLESLLERARQANYYDEPQWVATFLHPDEGKRLDVLRKQHSYRELADVLGLSVEAVYALTLHRFVPAFYGSAYRQLDHLGRIHQLGDLNQPLWEPVRQRMFVRPWKHPCICPLCWQEQHARLLPWWLSPVTSCPRHQVVLVSTCMCGAPATMCTSDLTCQHCGTPVPIIATDDEASRGLATLIWSAIGCNDEPFPPLSLSLECAADHPLHRMTPTICLEFLWHGARMLSNHSNVAEGQRQPYTIAERHTRMVALARAFLDWPHQWYVLLEQVLEQEGLLLSYHQRLPYLLHNRFQGAAWEWLYEAWVQFVLARANRDERVYSWLPSCRAYDVRSHSNDDPRLMTYQEAMRVLEVSEPTLQAIIRSGLLQTPIAPTNDGSAAWNYIFSASVRWLQREQEQRWSLAKAAVYLGVGEDSVEALVHAGLLARAQPLPLDGQSVWIFTQEHLDAMLHTLLQCVPTQPIPNDDSGTVLRLEVVMRLVRWSGVRLPRLLWDIQRGDLVAFREEGNLRLATLWFERSAVQDYCARQRQPANELLTMQRVCEHLHCKPSTLCRLRDAGLLVPCAEDNHWRYAAADVDAFLERYVDSDGAAAILGVTRITVQQWVRAGRLPAVTGPDIDGSHVYRFEQEELHAWRHERLTAGETQVMLGINRATLHRWVGQGKLIPLEGMGKQRWFARDEVEGLVSWNSNHFHGSGA